MSAFSSSDWSTYADICRCSSARQNRSKATFSLSESSYRIYFTALRLTECTAGAAVQCAPLNVKSTCTKARVYCYKYPTSIRPAAASGASQQSGHKRLKLAVKMH